jgi:hypothetical protein
MDFARDIDPRLLPLVDEPHSRYPVLDLSQVPEDQWVDALVHFHPSTYHMSADTVGFERVGKALAAAGRAELDRAAKRERPRAKPESWWFPPGLPTPEIGPAPTRRRRQVNFRLRAAQYDDLAEAAELMNMRPTQLAGLLVVRGVDQILREAKPRA